MPPVFLLLQMEGKEHNEKWIRMQKLYTFYVPEVQEYIFVTPYDFLLQWLGIHTCTPKSRSTFLYSQGLVYCHAMQENISIVCVSTE